MGIPIRPLALLGIAAAALNLRTAVASLSPVVDAVTGEIPLGSPMLGVLGMLPPLCFAAAAFLTPLLAHRLGLERSLVLALTLLAVGLGGRGGALGPWSLAAASVVAFAALGVLNVLLPPLVKKYFPDRLGAVTTLYVTLMSVGTFLPPLVAVPVADAWGWRASLAQWVLLAIVAIVPWLPVLRSRAAPEAEAPGLAAIAGPATASAVDPGADPAMARRFRVDPALLGRLLRSPIAWSIGMLCAAPGFIAYAMFAWLPSLLTDVSGVDAAQAGALLALYAAMGAPAGLLVPILAARMRHVGWLIFVGGVFFVAGFTGLLVAAESAPWAWATLAGLGQLLFPLSLVLINLRSRTTRGAIWLSSFSQGFGYLLAALGPLLVAVLHDTTAAWTAAILVLLTVAVAGTAVGLLAARPRFIEDDIR
jgi:CP family cyanate transporter-like MFS transporter